MNQNLLSIQNLQARVEEKEILRGLNLDIKPGEVHAIMGPNGAGKSTLSAVLAGRQEYEVTEGQVDYNGKDLLEMSPEDRAREGVFLAFQYPVEIDEDDDSDERDIDDIFGIMSTPKKAKEIKLNFEPPKEMIDLI